MSAPMRYRCDPDGVYAYAPENAEKVRRARALLDEWEAVEPGNGMLAVMGLRRALRDEPRRSCCDHHAGWADAPSCEDETEAAARVVIGDWLSRSRQGPPYHDDAPSLLQALADAGYVVERAR